MSDNEYDFHLWLRIGRGGEIAAFRELFDRHYAPLCRFAEFWLRDRASAEEVVLDVYTHVWQHAAELRIAVSVRAYLFRAVRNRALNRLRDDRFSYIPFEELGGGGFRQPRAVADRDRRDHAARGRSRLPAARALPRRLPQKPQRATLERRNSRRNANFRQDRRSADEQGAATPARSASQRVTRRGRDE